MEDDVLKLKEVVSVTFDTTPSCQIPVHDVAPRAVSIAEAIETINCAINLAVSFFVITHLLSLRINHRGRIVVVVIVATTSLRTSAAL